MKHQQNYRITVQSYQMQEIIKNAINVFFYRPIFIFKIIRTSC